MGKYEPMEPIHLLFQCDPILLLQTSAKQHLACAIKFFEVLFLF